MTDLELLAPARTADIGIAAIDCGADSVYIAGPEFGARQAAGNSVEDIRRLCEYAHKYGVRIFAAVNTIVYDGELERSRELLMELQEAGVDAVIVQDLGLSPAALACSAFNGLKIPLHASTQCAIRTPERAAFYESLGFSRLILERELSLEQIRAIRSAVGCELEFFVHGALCVCYSGQCYISEHISGRSANRGACIQACRSLYDLVDGQGRKLVSSKPLLSLKDFNLKTRLFDLAEAGVTSFKIEGRLKNASYVKNIVREYSLALDELVARHPQKYRRSSFGRVTGAFQPQPQKTFNRGYTTLFLDGRRGDWASGEAAKSIGEHVGRVERLSKDGSRFSLRPLGPGLRLNNGDGFCFVSQRQEVIGFRGDVCDSLNIKCKPVPELFQGAEIYRNIDVAFERELESGRPSRYLGVNLVLTRQGSPETGVTVRAVSEDGREVSAVLGADAQIADNQERMSSVLATQLSKRSGHYEFSVSGMPESGLPFLPVSAINAFRRDLATALDAIPLIFRPLHKVTFRDNFGVSSGVGSDGADGNDCRDGLEAYVRGRIFSYKENVANEAARGLLLSLGAEAVEPAFELDGSGRRERIAGGADECTMVELMRTRYCIRYQYGRCPRHHSASWPAKLYLQNNGRRFPLIFDCKNCEMVVCTEE